MQLKFEFKFKIKNRANGDEANVDPATSRLQRVVGGQNNRGRQQGSTKAKLPLLDLEPRPTNGRATRDHVCPIGLGTCSCPTRS